MREALGRFFFEGGSAHRLAATRLLLGLGLIPFHALQYYSLLRLDPFGPSFHFVYPIWYFDWLGVEALSPVLCLIAFTILMAATLAFALGWRTRAAAVISLLAILFLKGSRDSVAGDVHHREIVPFLVLLLFAASRCGDAFSLDARRRGGAAPLSEWEATWPVRAAQAYVASFYFWSGVAKLRMAGWDWIRDGERLQVLLLNRAFRFGAAADGSPEGSAFALWFAHQPALLMLLAVATIAMEVGFPLLLLVRSFALRALFLGGVSAFHLANFVLMKVKFVFLPIVFVLFFDPSALVARWLERLERSSAPASGPLREPAA